MVVCRWVLVHFLRIPFEDLPESGSTIASFSETEALRVLWQVSGRSEAGGRDGEMGSIPGVIGRFGWILSF